jgi:hypothetical protein
MRYFIGFSFNKAFSHIKTLRMQNSGGLRISSVSEDKKKPGGVVASCLAPTKAHTSG